MDIDTVIPADKTQWNHCHQCGDSRIEGGFVEIDGIYAFQTVTCACGWSWRERYVAQQREEFEYQ